MFAIVSHGGDMWVLNKPHSFLWSFSWPSWGYNQERRPVYLKSQLISGTQACLIDLCGGGKKTRPKSSNVSSVRSKDLN